MVSVRRVIAIVAIVLTVLVFIGWVWYRYFYLKKKSSNGSQPTRLRVTNDSGADVWIQQMNIPDEPTVVKIENGKYYDYDIPDEGVPSVRVWPKTECDSSGNNCTTGQSQPPCPATGCTPPFESKVEFTFGDISDSTSTTDYDVSFADGYSLPVKVLVKNGTSNVNLGTSVGDAAAMCISLDFTGLTLDRCPTSDTLAGVSGVDLRVKDNQGNIVGCMGPCQKTSQPAPWGLGYTDLSEDPSLHMCCPTPCNFLTCNVGDACNCAATNCQGCVPSANCTFANGCATSNSCGDSSDPNSVVNTDYYKTIKKYAKNAYGYAYDDNSSNPPVLMSCPSIVQYEIIFG